MIPSFNVERTSIFRRFNNHAIFGTKVTVERKKQSRLLDRGCLDLI